MIIYICINLVIVYIENKYSLCIHFKKEYEEYAKKTPAYMNQELWLFAIFYLLISFQNVPMLYDSQQYDRTWYMVQRKFVSVHRRVRFCQNR